MDSNHRSTIAIVVKWLLSSSTISISSETDMDTDTYVFFSLFSIEASCMWKYGVRCAECHQKVPMSFVPATLFSEAAPCSGRATLRRRAGITSTLPSGKDIDNHWIVSYNIYAIEVCISYQCCSVHICEPHLVFIQIQFQGWGL
jgi:hypothetical protein